MPGDERMIRRFKRLISDKDVVSFDVFGTLLKRSCKDESFVFDLAFSRWATSDLEINSPFAQARRRAGSNTEARNIQRIDEIYQRIPFLTDCERKELAICEMDCERALLRANTAVFELYRIAISQGKRIVATSDMYLPSRFIANLLQENGYGDIERVFVSCEEQVDKQSGQLFDAIAHALCVDQSRILHVGDSLQSDVLGARKSGVGYLYCGDHLVSKGSAKFASTFGLERNSNSFLRYDPSDESAPSSGFLLGFEALGPLLVSFAYWVTREAGSMRQIYFLARDAKLIMSVCEALFPQEANRFHYLHVSRETLCCVALCSCKTLSDVQDAVRFPRLITPESFSGAVGIGNRPEVVELFDSIGMRWNEAFDLVRFFDDERLRGISEQLLRFIKERACVLKQRLEAYLLQEGLDDGACLIDVGWHGTAQRSLEAATGHSLIGLYLGTSDTSELDARGYLYDDGDMQGDSLMAGYWGLFESFFATGEGITCDYADENGRLIPVLAQSELTDESMEAILEVQGGAMAFTRMYRETIGCSMYDDTLACEALAQIKALGEHPRLRDINSYGNIEFLDFGVIRPIVGRPRRFRYIRDPQLLKRDFYDSTWRIGFMKRVFFAPLNYNLAFRTARMLFGGEERTLE